MTTRAELGVAVMVAVLCGCSPPAMGGAGGAAGSSRTDRLSGTLTVFAASSLTDAFDRLTGDFQQQYPGVHVRINYGPSSGLAQSIVQGAPVDVFASANTAQMAVVTGAALAAGPVVFTSNGLEIAVPKGNPGKVTGLADFARGDLTLAICAPQVPCGAAAGQVFRSAGITPKPDSLEEDVRAALTKVELGEVDAALVYASDVASAGGRVEGIEFPQARDAVNQYPICVLKNAPNAQAGQAFVDLVRSARGQRVLADAGFRAP